jgi:hypothetical protein
MLNFLKITMKKIVFLFITILFGKNLFANESQNSFDTIKIGDFIYGGIVFLVDTTGQHGLVCAKVDQVKGIHWYDDMSKATNFRKDDKGTGELNNTLNNDQKKDDNYTENLATKVCADYSILEGGVLYDNWYLPSREELYHIYVNKEIIDKTAVANGGNNFTINNELNPTEYCNSPSWDQIFNYGYQDYDYKNSIFNVRAIRAF